MTAEPTKMRPPPEGYRVLPSRSPFVNRTATFYLRDESDGSRRVGTWIGEQQANSEGFAHGGFLLTFADFALSILTHAITLNITADFLRPGRLGDWIEMTVVERKRSSTLVFADALVTSGEVELMRVSGLFRPFESKP